MNFKIEDKQLKTPEMKLGDIFVSRVTAHPYMLIDAGTDEKQFMFVSLVGAGRWMAFDDLGNLIAETKKDVDEGDLTWYSQDQYELVLKRKD